MEFTVEALETPALTKAQLAELLFEQIGLNKRESKDMIDAFFDLIADSLVEGQDVKISGFGNFQIRTKAPRPGPQPAHRRGHPDRRAPRRHLPCQPKLKEQIQGEQRSARADAESRVEPRTPNKCFARARARRVTSKLSLVPH